MRKTVDVLLRVVVLEEEAIARERVLVPRLLAQGFDVAGCACMREIDELMARWLPDIVVMGVDLEDGDGFAVVQGLRWRHPAIGLVVLTGRQGRMDQVRGLVHGADAYLARPVDMDVLAATLLSLGRRLLHRGPAACGPGQWRLDCGAWKLLSPKGDDIALSRNERATLQCLFESSGAVVSRERLIAALTPDVFNFDPHRLDSLISRLRRKVLRNSGEPLPLSTVHGEGYVLLVS